MKYIPWILIGISCYLVWSSVTLLNTLSDSQQLIDDKVELVFTVAEQNAVIESQAKKLEELTIKHEEFFKTALEVADENYALNKTLEDMVVSMKQMFEYIKKLEERLKERDD